VAQVKVVRVEGRQKKRDKRTFTPDEFRKLLAVAGKRAGLYLMAVLTGLRRGELKQLRWGDVKLAGENSALRIRASISKNHREANLPLHPDVVAALQKMRPAVWQSDQKIFARLYPGYKRFYADLKAAGIDHADGGKGRLCFHSFRHTFCTQLAMIDGMSERARQELLRHQNPDLTAETYTEAKTLRLATSVNKLNFHRAANDTAIDTQDDAQTRVLASPSVSPVVTLKAKSKSEIQPVDIGIKSLSVTASHAGSLSGEWSERQDLNLRHLGPKPSALPG
jgi:integrase